MSCFEPLLAVALLASPDAGVRESPVKAAIEQLARAATQQADAQRKESEKQLEVINIMQTQSDSMARLVQHLLDVSRFQAGAAKL